MDIIILGFFGALIVGVIVWFLSTYKVVLPSEAHLVTTPQGRFVASSDENLSLDGSPIRRAYFAIPSWVPFYGRQVRIMDVTIKEIQVEQETFERNQARFMVSSSTKYRMKDIKTAAETFIDEKNLEEQLEGVIEASVRAATSKFDVVDARANKQAMEEEVRSQMLSNFKAWGLELVNFQLVNFNDTPESAIISNISKRREAEIESDTRQNVANRIQIARVKEAEADQIARQREIQKDQVVAEQEQIKNQAVSVKQQEAQNAAYEVIRVQTIQQANIDKEKAIVLAEQNRATEEINKARKQLEGEGDRLKQEEQAKGLAAPIRENGLANAEAKDRLQAALNKFTPTAIQALTAELQVDANKQVGLKTAEALSQADVKVFAGGGESKAGFDLGQLVSSMSVSNPNVAGAFISRMAIPNNLGFNQNPSLDKKD